MKSKNEFEMKIAEFYKELGTHKIMTLSTFSDKRVTSRSMSVVVINGKLYCQTDRNSLKCSQITANKNVAVTVGNISIEGVCVINGKPADNKEFMQMMKKHFLLAYAKWSHYPDECLLEISPVFAHVWKYTFKSALIEHYDFINQKCEKEYQYGQAGL